MFKVFTKAISIVCAIIIHSNCRFFFDSFSSLCYLHLSHISLKIDIVRSTYLLNLEVGRGHDGRVFAIPRDFRWRVSAHAHLELNTLALAHFLCRQPLDELRRNGGRWIKKRKKKLIKQIINRNSKLIPLNNGNDECHKSSNN